MSDSDLFLDVAHRIGQRIARQALWDGDACTWQVMVPDRDRPDQRSAVPAPAGGALYQGTAGIALFLAALYKHTLDVTIKRTTEGALQHALRTSEALPGNSFGFYSGRVGIAYSCAQLASCLDEERYINLASKVLAPLKGNEDQDRGLDVIAGAAGAIPALLQLAGLLEEDWIPEMAARLGDHLLRQACKAPVGWSWSTITPAAVRNLCGYAHGASGFGYALFELYHATGKGDYLYAAEQAFLYERQFFNEETSNWPDLRYTELSNFLYYRQHDELRKMVKQGLLPAYEVKYMDAWCHGAPGIGLTRLRAYELLGHSGYKKQAEDAIRSTVAALESNWGNYSLCHGRGGNCETLLYAAQVFQQPGLRVRAEDVGREGADVYERAGRPWPCGTEQAVSDPSLMLGEAGIGYYYLRLFSEKTPSLLIRYPASKESNTLNAQVGYRRQQRKHVDLYFGRTRLSLDVFPQVRFPEVAKNDEINTQDSAVTRTFRALERLIDTLDPVQKVRVEDAFLVERTHYQLTLSLTDFTEEFLDTLRAEPIEDISRSGGLFSLTSYTQVVQTQWDWDKWFDSREQDAKGEPEQDSVVFLLYRRNNRICVRRLSPFTVLVLKALETPASLPIIVSRVKDALQNGGDIDAEQLERAVIQQLQEAYRAGFIRWTYKTKTGADAEMEGAFV